MADRMNQGMEYEQELPWMAHAGPDGRMHTFETFTPASMRQQQQQQQHQQQQYYYQSQQEYQQQYAQLVNPQQQQQQYLHQQQQQQQQASNYPPRSPQTSHFPVPANASANSNNNMMTHQMRRMRRNNPLGSSPTMTRNELSDGSDMTVDGNDSSGTYGAGGSMTRRNAFLDTIDPAIRRKVEAAQVYFLEYYVDHLTYVANRRMRLGEFKHAIQSVRTSAQHVQDSWRDHCIRETAILRRRRNRTREREFDILAQIGQGGYGQVFLARKRDTGEVCALKKMAKKLLVKLGEVQHILTERDILRTSKSPWLVKLLYSFQDQQFLYLAMEYVPGGDVRTLLNQNGILRHHIARFYIAEMMVAVAALHSFGYFHRDLKPENYIIDASGHVKLTDFGLSHGHLSRPTLEAMKKKLDKVKDQEIIYHSSSEKRSFYKVMRQDDMPRAYSIVGSPDYMAPEILYTSLAIDQKKKQQHKPSDNSPFARLDDTTIGYDLRVDYWSLGCILYEFLASYAPFTGPVPDDVWRNVYHWTKAFQRPEFESQEAAENMTAEAWDLISQLIAHRDKRLSSINEAKVHPYFQGMDLLHLRETERPPFVPELQSETDKAYFDDFSNPNDMELYRDVYNKRKELDSLVGDGGDNTSVDPAAFIGFTYRHNRQNRFV